MKNVDQKKSVIPQSLKDFLADVIRKYGILFVLRQMIDILRDSNEKTYREMAADLEEIHSKYKNRL